MAIHQGDIGIHDIKLGSINVFEIYQGSKLVYPENTEVTITFKLNVSGIVTINGYTPVISENNTKFVFTIPVKTNYTANITAEHYKSQTISGKCGYLPITHNVELEWEQRFISYTVTFPTDGVKVLFDGIEKGVITNGKLVILIDDTEAKDSYTVTFKGSKASIYDTSTLTVVDSTIANTGGVYDLKLPTSFVKSGYKRIDYASSTGSITKGSTYAGTWIEIVVSLTASFTSSTTLGSISNNVLTIPNNESTNAKSGTLTVIFTLENKQTKEFSAALNQAAGAKVYTDWVLDLQTDGTSVEAKGGTRTVTANIARRTYKWNNTGTVYSETATPTLSISGSASLSGNQIKFTSNESVSARSATLTASYAGLSKTVTITQQAGTKVYSAWSDWTVSISASTQTIAATGGSSTITTNASRSRTWTWNGVGTTHTDTENDSPTLSKSGDGTLSGTTSGSKLTYGNRTATTSRSTTVSAIYSGVIKSIDITQSAGVKVYGAEVYHTEYYGTNPDGSGLDFTGYSCTNEIDTVADANTISISVYYRLYATRLWTWNGVAGSGGNEFVYYNSSDVNVTNKVNCDVSVANIFNHAKMIMITLKPSVNDSDIEREYKIEWNWLNHNIITKGTQRANPMGDRLAIKNDYFTSENIALPIYLDSEKVDSIYKGEASYIDIKKTPIDVYVYIPTNISIVNAGKLQFWFENKDDSASKYTCTLSSVSTPSNNVSVSNSNNIISVTANTTTSLFTILCQFTMTSNNTVFNVRVLIEP